MNNGLSVNPSSRGKGIRKSRAVLYIDQSFFDKVKLALNEGISIKAIAEESGLAEGTIKNINYLEDYQAYDDKRTAGRLKQREREREQALKLEKALSATPEERAKAQAIFHPEALQSVEASEAPEAPTQTPETTPIAQPRPANPELIEHLRSLFEAVNANTAMLARLIDALDSAMIPAVDRIKQAQQPEGAATDA